MVSEVIIAVLVGVLFSILVISMLQRKEQSISCSILIVFNVFFTSWISTVLVVFFPDISARLDGFNKEVIHNVYYMTSFSVIIIFMGLLVYFLSIDNKKMSLHDQAEVNEAVYVINPLSLLFIIYCLVKFILFYQQSPLYYVALGDYTQAALSRASIQKGEVFVDIPYIGKIFYFLCFYITISTMILVSNNKVSRMRLFFIIAVSSIQLTFDGQKAHLFLLFMMMGVTYFLLSKSVLKIIIFSISFVFTTGLIYSTMMSGDGNALVRILDRSIFGQAQGMYYIMQYYKPQLTGVFSDLPFSHLLGLKELKPDEWIVPYIYSDSGHVINSNTFIVGEMWAYSGELGVYLFSSFILFSLLVYLIFFRWLTSLNNIVYWPISLIFFSTLPINQSLQFIIYQKYFLYVLFFLILPIYTVGALRYWGGHKVGDNSDQSLLMK
ncbi:hypothetical protein ACET7V_01050 [Aeromonas sanarellii]|uniref:hypothetical protein n=1 Tax=Aeromonas sanarellii TaxID=633415 RepID=UPI000A8BC472|nr:hypothetical protein [Aeromonas sanarellii]